MAVDAGHDDLLAIRGLWSPAPVTQQGHRVVFGSVRRFHSFRRTFGPTIWMQCEADPIIPYCRIALPRSSPRPPGDEVESKAEIVSTCARRYLNTGQGPSVDRSSILPAARGSPRARGCRSVHPGRAMTTGQ